MQRLLILTCGSRRWRIRLSTVRTDTFMKAANCLLFIQLSSGLFGAGVGAGAGIDGLGGGSSARTLATVNSTRTVARFVIAFASRLISGESFMPHSYS